MLCFAFIKARNETTLCVHKDMLVHATAGKAWWLLATATQQQTGNNVRTNSKGVNPAHAGVDSSEWVLLLTTHGLHSYSSSQCPEVSIADPWVLGLDGVQHLLSNIEASICTMVNLRREPKETTQLVRRTQTWCYMGGSCLLAVQPAVTLGCRCHEADFTAMLSACALPPKLEHNKKSHNMFPWPARILRPGAGGSNHSLCGRPCFTDLMVAPFDPPVLDALS